MIYGICGGGLGVRLVQKPHIYTTDAPPPPRWRKGGLLVFHRRLTGGKNVLTLSPVGAGLSLSYVSPALCWCRVGKKHSRWDSFHQRPHGVRALIRAAMPEAKPCCRRILRIHMQRRGFIVGGTREGPGISEPLVGLRRAFQFQARASSCQAQSTTCFQ